MNLHHYGERLVADYNAAHRAVLTATEFFEERAAPILFGEDGRDLVHVSNSPFIQKMRFHEGRERVEAAMEDLMEKIESGEAHMSVLPGAGAKSDRQPTAGQTSTIAQMEDADRTLAAWLGLACGIDVAGGLTLFDPAVGLRLYCGWSHYRAFLNANPAVKPRQIGKWNAYWIASEETAAVEVLGRTESSEDDPLGHASRHIPSLLRSENTSSKRLQPLPWAAVVCALARASSRRRTLYVMRLRRMNTTLGYLPFAAGHVRTLFDLYASICESALDPPALAAALDLKLSLYDVARIGHLGLRALAPSEVLRRRRPDEGEGEQLGHQHLGHHYLTAYASMMTDNADLKETAQRAASTLRRFAEGAERGRTARANLVETLLAASSVSRFAAALEKIIDEEPSAELRSLMHAALEVPQRRFYLFTRLVAIEYKTPGDETAP